MVDKVSKFTEFVIRLSSRMGFVDLHDYGRWWIKESNSLYRQYIILILIREL